MHFKRTRSERLSREKFTKLFANFESVVFLYTNKQHWVVCLVNECFSAQCFSKILQDIKYHIFIAEIESNNIIFFLKNTFKYNISHPCLH